MAWINLVVCIVRFFAFAITKWPIIIRRHYEHLNAHKQDKSEEMNESNQLVDDDDPQEVRWVAKSHRGTLAAASSTKREHSHSSVTGLYIRAGILDKVNSLKSEINVKSRKAQHGKASPTTSRREVGSPVSTCREVGSPGSTLAAKSLRTNSRRWCSVESVGDPLNERDAAKDEGTDSLLTNPETRNHQKDGTKRGRLLDWVYEKYCPSGIFTLENLHLFFRVLGDTYVQYEFAFIICAVIATLVSPLWTSYSLLEIGSWKGSKIVIKAVRLNANKMLQTMVIAFLMTYLWMVIGIGLNLLDSHQENLCTTMFQCFFSYLYKAMRDNGVYEMLKVPGKDFEFPRNIEDAFADEDQGSFIIRFFWDMVFQWLFIYIVLAIIIGIVIDGFVGLKEEHEESERDLKSVCFICHLSRFHLDQAGIGFDLHVRREHNPRNYLLFLLFLQRKPKSRLTCQEIFIKNKVWPAKGHRIYDWLPREVTLTLQTHEQQHSHIVDVHERLRALEEGLERESASNVAAFARLESSVARVLQALGEIYTNDEEAGSPAGVGQGQRWERQDGARSDESDGAAASPEGQRVHSQMDIGLRRLSHTLISTQEEVTQPPTVSPRVVVVEERVESEEGHEDTGTQGGRDLSPPRIYSAPETLQPHRSPPSTHIIGDYPSTPNVLMSRMTKDAKLRILDLEQEHEHLVARRTSTGNIRNSVDVEIGSAYLREVGEGRSPASAKRTRPTPLQTRLSPETPTIAGIAPPPIEPASSDTSLLGID